MSSSTQAPDTPSDTLHRAEEALLATAGIPIERHDTLVHGVRLHYLTCGEGEPLLLLHGRGDAGALFTSILPQLAKERRVITLDLPGWGLSDKPPFTEHTAREALNTWVEGVIGFLDDQGLESVDLLGHSMGGFVALGAALAHPARISRLILVDAAGLGTDIQWDTRLYFALGPEKLHRRLGPRFTRLVLRLSGGEHTEEPSAEHFNLAHALLTQAEVIPSGAAAFNRWINFTGVHLTLTDRLKELDMPVLLLWGDSDAVCHYANALVAAHQLRDGQLVAFTHCGHAPFRERPDDFAHVLLTWLKGIYVPPRA
jgi:pimeloyl-ACP methyl ester carboxylesterase